MNEPHTLDQLEARVPRPAGETRVVARDFNEVMRMAAPKQPVLPPAESGGIDAAKAWQDAISGRAHQPLDVIDRQAAADSWRKAVDASAPQAGLDRHTGQREMPPPTVERVASEVIAVSAEHLAPSEEPAQPAPKAKRGWLR